MAALVESIAYKNATPWHGLGTKVPNGEISPEEMMIAAGLDWEVALDDVYNSRGEKIPGSKLTYRTSDNKMFDIVGDRYTILQNKDAFSWFQPFVDSKSVEFETAGALKEGRVIFVTAKVKNTSTEIVKNDRVDSYILLSHSHDGTLSVRGGFTPIRVVCNNTLTSAHKSSSSKLLKMKHTRGLNLAMEQVQKIMDVAKQEFIATTEQYKFLASKNVNKKDLEKFVTLLVNKGDQDEDKNIKRSYERIEQCFDSGIGQGTNTRNYWGLYNALNEVLNYHAGREQSNRLQSLWFGQGKVQDQLALDIATKMAKGEI